MKINIAKRLEQLKEERNEVRTTTRKSSIFRQLLAGCTANLTLINVGLQFGWPTVSLPTLQDEKAEIHVTSSEGAWIVSFLLVGACLGPVISVNLVNSIGRKWTLLLTVIPSIGSWVLVYYAKDAQMFCIARFIGGIALGSTFATVPMYVGEIAEKETRGALGSVVCIMISLGIILICVLGPFFTIPIMSLIATGSSLIFMITFIWMPETPYYYLTKRKYKEAERALIWLRRRRDVDLELQEMCILTRKEVRLEGGIKELIKTRGNRLATLIVLVTFGAQEMAGFTAITAYSGLILQGIADEIDPGIVITAGGVVTLIFFFLASFIIDKIGRKLLMFLSAVGDILCLVLMGLYFQLRSKDTEDVNCMFWLLVVPLLALQAFYAIGLGPVPWAIVSELYPLNVKASATMVFSIYSSILSFFTCKLYQVVTDQWGEPVVFYSCATIEVIFIGLAMFIVFETKGKSFKEIQDRLNGIHRKEITSPDKAKLFIVDSPSND
ncbi:facilitated trehalose transporter Tret1-like isoform X1 [Venturia canescens]|uniref:facilitated trehalose transporter Tret1-like isoform X1 n=1 Tax=Venturia canescens TaxID=32260 RepID=UPI001C9BEB32|nr:facilitated trehalose transporter Tret1-like isoform X1 [Venturia canescens]XP_043266450.1 facilitated trehalose transporter Tret1-like isoform X1 [Venturia canescens]